MRIQASSGRLEFRCSGCTPLGSSKKHTMLKLYHVDYLFITEMSNRVVGKIRHMLLTADVSMSDLGNVAKIVGIEVRRDNQAGTISLSQEKYILSVLE